MTIDGDNAAQKSLINRSAQTERLSLRKLAAEDARFMLRLLNEPSFLLYIGDKGVRTVNDAEAFLITGPMTSYEYHGFGLYKVSLLTTGEAVGVCGLLRRPTMPDPDLGFAFLPEFWAQGYAYESACEILRRARRELGLRRVVAITAPDNNASIKLLEKLGFEFTRVLDSFGDAGKSNLYECVLSRSRNAF